MNTTTRTARSLIALLLAALAIALLPPPPPADAGTRLPDDVADLARRLADVAVDDTDEPDRDADDGDAEDLDSATPRLEALVVRLTDLADRIGRSDRRTAAGLRDAAVELSDAAASLLAGTRDTTASHLRGVLGGIGKAVGGLGLLSPADRGTAAVIATARQEATDIAMQVATPTVRRALGLAAPDLAEDLDARFRRLAVLVADGRFDDALGGLGPVFADASAAITFDVELFEQLVRDAFDGEAVGYNYAIAVGGTIVAEDGVGEARTAPDGAAAQEADKQVQIASVSKTLTAILILRLMEEHGVAPDTAIADYLPSDWTLGTGVAQITFAQLLTHTSGLKQLVNLQPSGSVSLDHEGLRDLLEEDLPGGVGPHGSLYTNTNFALLRVLSAGLQGIDTADFAEFEAGTLTASAFATHLEQVYGSIGVPTSCSPTDPAPTLMYDWPLDGTAGAESSDKVLTCGGYGFFISAHELAGVLTTLRHTEELLSDEQRQLMREGRLGINRYVTDHGDAFGHGGKWNPGMQSCAMMFPIAVEIGVSVNSIGGDYPSPCSVVIAAFNDAWVAA